MRNFAQDGIAGTRYPPLHNTRLANSPALGADKGSRIKFPYTTYVPTAGTKAYIGEVRGNIQTKIVRKIMALLLHDSSYMAKKS